MLPPSSVRNARATPPFFGFSAVSGHSFGCFHNSLAILVRSKPWGKCLPLTLTIGGPKKWPKVPKKVVRNARATFYTKANVTNICDDWVGKGDNLTIFNPTLLGPWCILWEYFWHIFGLSWTNSCRKRAHQVSVMAVYGSFLAPGGVACQLGPRNSGINWSQYSRRFPEQLGQFGPLLEPKVTKNCKKKLFVTLVLPPYSVRNARATPPFFWIQCSFRSQLWMFS